MANTNIELSLMDAEEKQQLEYIWNLIPAKDRDLDRGARPRV